MSSLAIKKQKRDRRHKRIRARVFGTSERPRFTVYRSNRALYGQIIDDEKGITLVSIETDKKAKAPLKEKSYNAGKSIAESAKGKKITKVIFDRGGFMYTGSVKAFAEGAREGGMSF